MIALSVSTLVANEIDTKVLKFLSKSVSTSDKYKVTNISLIANKDISAMPSWKVYFIKIDLDLVGKNKSISITDKLFTNGVLVTKDLIDINTNKSIKDEFLPDFQDKFYNDANIIAGNTNATNKLAVFSDPLCPFCMDFMPELISFVETYPEQFVLYYYHFPLNIHPNSPTLIKAGLVAKKQGIKNVDMKVYKEAFDFDKDDDKLVLQEFNKVMGTKITLEDINQKDILKHLEEDEKIVKSLMLRGTPRLFTNSKLDKNRLEYKKLLKK
jgi:thiol-disulfide isomerase/thioredoxin